VTAAENAKSGDVFLPQVCSISIVREYNGFSYSTFGGRLQAIPSCSFSELE
jgi:hypothetical protein